MAPSRSRAAQFTDLEDRIAKDYDPEDAPSEFSDDDASDAASDELAAAHAGRAHYADVGKSKLRKRDVAPLGPQYTGSRVSRSALLEGDEDEERDPFEGYGSDAGSIVEGGEDGKQADEDEEEEDESELADGGEDEDEQETGDTSMSGEDFDEDSEAYGLEDDEEEHTGTQLDREQLKKMVNEEHGSVAATIAQANKADADKGRAVKRQRQTFDALLNGRIRLQQGLVAVNSMAAATAASKAPSKPDDAFHAAEQAALNLWNTLDSLRSTIASARTGTSTGTKRKHDAMTITPSTPTSTIWSHMRAAEAAALPHRRMILSRWSTKTQAASAQPTRGKLTSSSTRAPTILDVLNEQLSNPDRLIARTRIPRSCAPLQANSGKGEDAAVFDDADFYGLLLKSLLEQRSIDAAANVSVDADALARQHMQAAREAKTKKSVDVKASKGRKLRYTVHEALQNFMAREERGSWTARQVDELCGSLLGGRVGLGEDVDDAEGDTDGSLGEEEALMLFRS